VRSVTLLPEPDSPISAEHLAALHEADDVDRVAPALAL
jgi:hypothetical protein